MNVPLYTFDEFKMRTDKVRKFFIYTKKDRILKFKELQHDIIGYGAYVENKQFYLVANQLKNNHGKYRFQLQYQRPYFTIVKIEKWNFKKQKYEPYNHLRRLQLYKIFQKLNL